mgnify:CR=1 FL=1
MKCPFCGSGESHVIDTRSSGERIRRRRECTDCGERFTTYERVVLSNPMVVKRDGRREEFDRAKLLAGVRKAYGDKVVLDGIDLVVGLSEEIDEGISKTRLVFNDQDFHAVALSGPRDQRCR